MEGALRGAFGVDSQLLRDGTYFLVLEDGVFAGCGGWSFRATLFGGDTHTDRDAHELDPATEPARIRAFFVDPTFARRGVATLLLERCESEARRRGFSRAALMATLPGVKFYAARGYLAGAPVQHDLGGGKTIEFVPMHKAIAAGRE